ncbi:MAG: D-tyrosyl-tRNA(Tyr) deacylase [Bacilli bacterium]|nr:D-tyrosyl-tRNA(Tyr) deacylase [Bacilli bacterium]
MKIVAQRVIKSKVEVSNKVVGEIEHGLMLLVSFTHTDTEENIDYMVKKVLGLRIFDDESGVMNRSVLDVGGSILSISQFTLYADTKKGNRPSYINALSGDKATVLYDKFNEKLRQFIKVETGIFGSEMKVSLINDGPVTIILEK